MMHITLVIQSVWLCVYGFAWGIARNTMMHNTLVIQSVAVIQQYNIGLLIKMVVLIK